MPPPTTGTHQESNTKPTMSAAGPEKTKVTASAQLQKWSIARRIRSGEKLDRSDITRKPDTTSQNSQRSIDTWSGEGNVSEASINVEEDTYTSAPETGGKAIYIVSDGTGWTAEHCVTAALRQFERCLIDRVCPVNTHLFSGVLDVERLLEIIKQAAKDRALLLYTLADPSMAESASNASRIWGVPSTDVLGPVRDSIASHLGVSPTGLPRGARPEPLSDEYFKRIDCVEFTIKQDDGALPQNLNKADIILAGVSRTGKTPLSIYLSQKGYKVANVPIVKGINLPASIFQVDSSKVFGLTINPVTLRTIRRARARTLGFGDEIECTYSEMDHVRDELEYAGKIFAQNPIWPVIEVTGKAIEETAAVILRLYYDRKQKCSMPRISRRY